MPFVPGLFHRIWLRNLAPKCDDNGITGVGTLVHERGHMRVVVNGGSGDVAGSEEGVPASDATSLLLRTVTILGRHAAGGGHRHFAALVPPAGAAAEGTGSR